MVKELLKHIKYFGYMGFIDEQFTNLPDKEFPECRRNIIGGRESEVLDIYQGLSWKAIDLPLFLDDSILEFDNQMKVLDFNRDLSSMLNIIAHDQNLIKIYFAQMRENHQFEGFVRIFDQGYQKSIYINCNIPWNKFRYFYITSGASWPLLLVKALAKFSGSYDNVSKLSFS